jgi:hypothetical protein
MISFPHSIAHHFTALAALVSLSRPCQSFSFVNVYTSDAISYALSFAQTPLLYNNAQRFPRVLYNPR